VPTEFADRARKAAVEVRANAVLCVGGDCSASGLAKAAAMTGSLSSGLPIAALPTTYAGSEATNVRG
jgi:maleylacetate reductase